MPARVTRGALVAHRHSNLGLLGPYLPSTPGPRCPLPYLYGTISMIQCTMVWNSEIFRSRTNDIHGRLICSLFCIKPFSFFFPTLVGCEHSDRMFSLSSSLINFVENCRFDKLCREFIVQGRKIIKLPLLYRENSYNSV